MSLSRLAQGHATSRSLAGSNSRPRLRAPRPPLAAAPQMKSSSLERGSRGAGGPPPPGARTLRCNSGLSLCIACCPLLSLCLFPLRDRERSQRVSRNATAEEMCFVRHREGQQGNGEQRGQGVRRLGRRPTPLLLQLLPNNGASGEMIRQQDGRTA